MKLTFDSPRSQPDPYVIKEGERYYMYATGYSGVQLYVSENRTEWRYEGSCFSREGFKEYWAPAVTEVEGTFYLYVSCMPKESDDVHQQRLVVAEAKSPEGPYRFLREIAEPFSIDPHCVRSGDGLYMFYSVNDYEAERAGTLIVVDKMSSPTELCGKPKIAVRATLDEEIFMRDRFRKGQHWHTLEGAFYFRVGDWHYLLYSGNCYQNENYYIGYAAAYGKEDDLTKLEFRKVPDEKTYAPLIRKNENEEGTGHNSVLAEDGHLYVFYHGRDLTPESREGERRTARICELVADGKTLRVINR